MYCTPNHALSIINPCPLYMQGTETEHTLLLRSRGELQSLVLQRMKELQLLTDWPLVRPARTQAQMDKLQQDCELCGYWGHSAGATSPCRMH